jgi:hypothetical protein
MARITPRVLAVAILSFAALAAYAQEQGSCVSAEIPYSIVLPDGSAYDAGDLRICFNRRLTPVTVINTVSVNGLPRGFFLSRTGTAEGPSLPHPVIAFRRDGAGALQLAGFASPGREHMHTFRFGPARTELVIGPAVDRLTRNDLRESDDVVLLAARLD